MVHGPPTRFPVASRPGWLLLFLCAAAVLSLFRLAACAQPSVPAQSEPHARLVSPSACKLRHEGLAFLQSASAAAADPDHPPVSPSFQPAPCEPLTPLIDWYTRFLNGPEVKPMTPAEKAHLAARNLLDPFNALTIFGTSAIAIGSDAHSPYGPGMKGFSKDAGASYAQDLTGEFFGTFLIPSLVHQDPHYHRMTSASVPRRIGHALLQAVWTRGDNGRPMVNYANLVGFAVDDAIGNCWLPGRDTRFRASAARYGVSLALAPEDNLITEFLPDVARRIHVRAIFVQRIINRVARPDATGP